MPRTPAGASRRATDQAPGSQGSNLSYSIWEADRAEELDAALRTLPNFPAIADVTVMPLIKHPLEEAYERECGPLPPL